MIEKEFELEVTRVINAILTGTYKDTMCWVVNERALMELVNHLYKKVKELEAQIRALGRRGD